MDKLCKDNVVCCDDNCKRCANLVYETYLKLKNEQAIDTDNDKVKIELVRGREGKCIYISDYRVAGSKPWGGGYTEYSWMANKDDILKSIRKPDTCRCLKEKDKEEYLGFWLNCECGYKLNTEQAVYCGGCGKKINVVGTIGDKAEF